MTGRFVPVWCDEIDMREIFYARDSPPDVAGHDGIVQRGLGKGCEQDRYNSPGFMGVNFSILCMRDHVFDILPFEVNDEVWIIWQSCIDANPVFL